MANTNTTVKAKDSDGELTLSHNTTDSPILPIAQLERLHALLPDRVEWVFEQTEKEAEFRRKEARRVNTLIAIERIGGILLVPIVPALGIVAAWAVNTYVDPTLTRSVLVMTAVATLAAAGAAVFRRKG